MLLRQECEQALKEIEEGTTEVEDWNSIPMITCNYFQDQLNILKQLIHEHFDNPPLKFEELKENMWIWDNNWEQYFEICEVYPQTKEFDVLIHQNRINKLRYEPMKFEENRFYRKQVIQ